MTTPKKPRIKKPKKIKITPMTVGEFRAKLEGIEMFQEDDWHPSKDQWDLIREMINNIQETIEVETEVITSENQTLFRTNNQPTYQPPNNQGIIQQPSALDNVQIPETNVSDLDIVPSGKPAINSQKSMGESTADGGYKSTFS